MVRLQDAFCGYATGFVLCFIFGLPVWSELFHYGDTVCAFQSGDSSVCQVPPNAACVSEKAGGSGCQTIILGIDLEDDLMGLGWGLQMPIFIIHPGDSDGVSSWTSI